MNWVLWGDYLPVWSLSASADSSLTFCLGSVSTELSWSTRCEGWPVSKFINLQLWHSNSTVHIIHYFVPQSDLALVLLWVLTTFTKGFYSLDIWTNCCTHWNCVHVCQVNLLNRPSVHESLNAGWKWFPKFLVSLLILVCALPNPVLSTMGQW